MSWFVIITQELCMCVILGLLAFTKRTIVMHSHDLVQQYTEE